MFSMAIFIKVTNKCVIVPRYPYDDAVGLYLYSPVDETIEPSSGVLIDIGVNVIPSEGYCCRIIGIDAMSAHNIRVMNGPMTPSDEGRLEVRLCNLGSTARVVEVGQPIAQLIYIPTIRPIVFSDATPEFIERSNELFYLDQSDDEYF